MFPASLLHGCSVIYSTMPSTLKLKLSLAIMNLLVVFRSGKNGIGLNFVRIRIRPTKLKVSLAIKYVFRRLLILIYYIIKRSLGKVLRKV